jgi:16S rRNA processing protein RimM
MVAENCQSIGKLTKLHGYEGEAFLIATNELPKKFEKTEWLFFIIEGLPVPFFISNIKLRNDSTAIIKLADINTSEEMKELIGLEILIEIPKKNKKSKQITQFNIEGYIVLDIKLGKVGIAKTVLNYQENYLLQVFNGNHEILIPVNEFNIGKIDDAKKTIYVDLPDGLFELNS